MALLHHPLKRESNEYGTDGHTNFQLSRKGNSNNVFIASKG